MIIDIGIENLTWHVLGRLKNFLWASPVSSYIIIDNRLIAELNVVGYEIFNFIAELNVIE